MSITCLNERQLALFLEEYYECICLGREFPRPYCDEDDMPTIWKTPSGFHFYVPTPPNGKYYELDHIELIIKTAKLDVVASLEKKGVSLADKIEDFSSK